MKQTCLPFVDILPAGYYPIPAGGIRSTCLSCGAALIWTTTQRGKPMPLSLASVIERDGVRYALSHFVDCPDAATWRKRP